MAYFIAKAILYPLCDVYHQSAGLESEQLAAIDFLVLAQSRSFVGFGASTMSFYLPQYKALLGKPSAPSVIVRGIDEHVEMYARVAVVDPLDR